MIDTSLTSSTFYFLLAVAQGVVLALLILFQKPRRRPHIFLGILIFFFSTALLQMVLEYSIHAFNAKYPIPLYFSFSYGPLAYFHILHIKNPERKFQLRELVHFLPSILLDVVLFTSFFIYVRGHMQWAYNHIPLIQGVALSIAGAGMIHLAIYARFMFKESQEARLLTKGFKTVQRWLSILVKSWMIMVVIFMITILISLGLIKKLDDNQEWLYLPLGSLNSLWIYILGYMYLVTYSKVIGTYMDKVRKFNIGSGELEQRKAELMNALEGDQLYKDPKLTLSRLAGHLGWPINSVSKMINDHLHTNFSDLINGLRVAAFKERSREPDSHKYSILGLGQEAGFSSKASFYRVFKQETGMTPTEYLKSRT